MNFNKASAPSSNCGGGGDAIMEEIISAAITASKPQIKLPTSTLPELKVPLTIYDHNRFKILKNIKESISSLGELHRQFKQGYQENNKAWQCYFDTLRWHMILKGVDDTSSNSTNSSNKEVLLDQPFSFFSKKFDNALKMKLGLMKRADVISIKILDQFKLVGGALDLLEGLPRQGANLSEEEMFTALQTLERNEKITIFNRDMNVRLTELKAEWNVLEGDMLESVKSVAVIWEPNDLGRKQ